MKFEVNGDTYFVVGSYMRACLEYCERRNSFVSSFRVQKIQLNVAINNLVNETLFVSGRLVCELNNDNDWDNCSLSFVFCVLRRWLNALVRLVNECAEDSERENDFVHYEYTDVSLLLMETMTVFRVTFIGTSKGN